MDEKETRKQAADERKRVQAQLKKEEDEYRKLEARYREELGVGSGSPSGSPGASPPLSPAGSNGGGGDKSMEQVDSENVNVEMKDGGNTDQKVEGY